MTSSNKRKQEQLGMPFGTACNRLRKSVMFYLVTRLGLDDCYRCGLKVELDNFSMEHKQPWLYAENPTELFFELDNIAFSHLKCNYQARRSAVKSI